MQINFNTFDKFKVDNKFKVFHKDIVTIKDNEIIIEKSNRDNLLLSGVLDNISNIIYGYNKQKKIYKLFHPFNKNFPNFLIAQKDEKTLYNKIIVIKYKNWNNSLPIGIIVKIIDILDYPKINVYSEAILYYNGYYDIKQNNTKYNILKNKYYDSYKNKLIKNNFNFICNIDPIKCSDIDDVISYKIENNNSIIGIHICNIIELFKNLEIDYKEIMNIIINNNIYNTIYTYDKRYDIISDELVNNFISLKVSEPKYVWSLYLHNKDNIIIDYEIKSELIINKESYSYDEIDIILKNKSNIYLNKISEFCYYQGQNNYKSIYNSYDEHLINSHYIITILMIIYNNYIGDYLKDNTKTIYKIVDNYESKYIYNNNNNYHSSLNLYNYLHFTSPIRRFIDQYNQIILYNKYENKNNILPEIDLNLINESIKDQNILNNKYKLLKLLKFDNKSKLIEYNLILENKLRLIWLIDNIKFVDIINIPLIENNRLYNRLNNNKYIDLIIGEYYKLDIRFELIGSIKMPKILIDYFSN
jgi:exoribonuclease R